MRVLTFFFLVVIICSGMVVMMNKQYELAYFLGGFVFLLGFDEVCYSIKESK